MAARRAAPVLCVTALLACLAWAPAPSPAQAAAGEGAGAVAPERGYATGDAWIDGRLADIDAYAKRYPASFLDEVGRNLSVRRAYAEAVLRAPGWRAGDLYFACAWAQATQRPCRDLVRARSAAIQEEWQAVLAALPTAPANQDYRQVRHAIVASYDRWDRPVPLDARLREQLGDREQRLERARQAAQSALEPAKPR